MSGYGQNNKDGNHKEISAWKSDWHYVVFSHYKKFNLGGCDRYNAYFYDLRERTTISWNNNLVVCKATLISMIFGNMNISRKNNIVVWAVWQFGEPSPTMVLANCTLLILIWVQTRIKMYWKLLVSYLKFFLWKFARHDNAPIHTTRVF